MGIVRNRSLIGSWQDLSLTTLTLLNSGPGGAGFAARPQGSRRCGCARAKCFDATTRAAIEACGQQGRETAVQTDPTLPVEPHSHRMTFQRLNS